MKYIFNAKNRFNDLGRQIHWMNRKYQLMGKKLNNVSISISDSCMIKFKDWRLMLHTTTLDTNLTFLFLGHFLVSKLV